MHGDFPGNPLQLHRAPLDLEVGDEFRGTWKRQDVIGDDDLVGSRERLDSGGDVERLPEVVEAIVDRHGQAGACMQSDLQAVQIASLAEVLAVAGQDARAELDLAIALYERKGNLVMAERTRSRLAALTGSR